MADPQTILAESGLLNALYGEQAAATTATGQATALRTEAGGTAAEAQLYSTASDISTQNAAIAQLSGSLQEYQNMRTLMNTLGKQAADISGAGFASSGTALSLARSSLQQGLLQNQVLGLNAELESGGFLQQAQASKAEQQAASTTSATQTAQANTATGIAAIDQAQQTQTNNFLRQIPGITFGPNGPTGLATVATGTGQTLGGRQVSASHPFVI